MGGRAAVLIRWARKLYVNDEVAVDLANTVYTAFDSTTIDLCLSLFHGRIVVRQKPPSR
jgi:hypothetical protein